MNCGWWVYASAAADASGTDARNVLTPFANRGDTRAQFAVGLLDVTIVTASDKIDWMTKAATQGHPFAILLNHTDTKSVFDTVKDLKIATDDVHVVDICINPDVADRQIYEWAAERGDSCAEGYLKIVGKQIYSVDSTNTHLINIRGCA